MATIVALIASPLATLGDTLNRNALKPFAHMEFSELNMA